MIETRFIEHIAQEAKVRPEQVAAAIPLFDKGATVPFVARYRKDVTQNLDEVALEKIELRNAYFIALTNRRNAVIENIEKQGKLTDELRAAIENVFDQTSLEDLYLPFKKQRRTKAAMAREQGLEPLADFVWEQSADGPSLEEYAARFVDSTKSVSSPEEALLGAQYILAERVSVDPQIRGMLRTVMAEEGHVTVKATKNAQEEKTKFEAYYDYEEPFSKVAHHRLLAILRGVRMGFLRMDIRLDDDALIERVVSHFLKPGSPYHDAIRVVAEDAYRRLLRPAIENEVVGIARETAEEAAITVFRENAEDILLAPPAGHMPVLGVDPGIKTGCKLAAVSTTGAYLEDAVIYLDGPSKDEAAAEETLVQLLERHGIHAIAVGNGTGSREAGHFIRTVLAKHGRQDGFVAYVNEAGASVYSASKLAREEFPDLDVTVRGAISIARRFQDPLAELVKTEARSIGVGQYQHDVNQRRLREGLTRTIESCVNRVGVDLNTASAELLRYISAIQAPTARNIITHRTENGPFKNRQQLLEVSGIGEKTFEQCAGFLRIPGGEEPLDATGIHPEAYPSVAKIATALGADVPALLGNRDLVRSADFEQFGQEEIGRFTLADIRQELMKPGRDPRAQFRVPKFLDNVHEVEQLELGMELEGVVTNVTDFGAFVDIGVHQDGLIHLSELSNRYVSDPRKVLHIGDIVHVRVIKLDKDLRRISLSRKAVLPPPRAKRTAQPKRRPEAAAKPAAAPAQRAPQREQRSGERRPPRERPAESRDRQKSKRPESRPRKPAPPKEGLNTLLADQLAALKDHFNS